MTFAAILEASVACIVQHPLDKPTVCATQDTFHCKHDQACQCLIIEFSAGFCAQGCSAHSMNVFASMVLRSCCVYVMQNGRGYASMCVMLTRVPAEPQVSATGAVATVSAAFYLSNTKLVAHFHVWQLW